MQSIALERNFYIIDSYSSAQSFSHQFYISCQIDLNPVVVHCNRTCVKVALENMKGVLFFFGKGPDISYIS